MIGFGLQASCRLIGYSAIAITGNVKSLPVMRIQNRLEKSRHWRGVKIGREVADAKLAPFPMIARDGLRSGAKIGRCNVMLGPLLMCFEEALLRLSWVVKHAIEQRTMGLGGRWLNLNKTALGRKTTLEIADQFLILAKRFENLGVA